jgi:hypothetical protein
MTAMPGSIHGVHRSRDRSLASRNLRRTRIDGIEDSVPIGLNEAPLPQHRRQPRRAAPATKSSLVALVAILALLLQAALPFPVGMAQAAAPTGVPDWLAGHLCLADAAKYPAPGTNDETPAKLPLCAICLGVQLSGTTLPPSPLTLTPPRVAGSIRFARPASEAPAGTHRTLAQARAPPSIL